MAKRRRYGDAWKDVQIDAEQNDAVFDRFFKRTRPEPDPQAAGAEVEPTPAGEGTAPPARASEASPAPVARPAKRPRPKATVSPITPALQSFPSDIHARLDLVKRQYRLSKGEAAILRYLLEKVEGEGGAECYAKVPELADSCGMTHRGCQFALRSLEARGFIVRARDYNPGDRRGVQFRVTLPPT